MPDESRQLGLESVDLDKLSIDRNAINKISSASAKFYNIFPVRLEKDTLTVALSDPRNLRVMDDLRFITGMNIRFVIAPEEKIRSSIERFYGEGEESLGEVINEAQKVAGLKKVSEEAQDADTLKEMASQAPVVKLLNMVLYQAVREKASDIHFEPFQNEYKIRYRIDGMCYDVAHPPKGLNLPISSRIKVMANLDVAESRLPQDGRIMLDIEGKTIDLRVSTLPTVFGESIVMRVLDRSIVSLSLDQLGLEEGLKTELRRLTQRPNGIILTTGPTGCGKTTTLYSCLREINKIDYKIITTEDPVEYDIPGIIQVAINPKIDLTFAKTLRHILRQDPDIIMVGEIRDAETAEISIQAALTGHLVLSTLHTNDAPSAVTRLMDMGVEPFLITSTVRAVIAQRLVRVICKNCKEEYSPAPEIFTEFNFLQKEFRGRFLYRGKGCSQCNGTGFKGRIGIFELLVIDDKIRSLIMERAQASKIRKVACESGMTTLRQNGFRKALEGVTTIEEVLRETREYI